MIIQKQNYFSGLTEGWDGLTEVAYRKERNQKLSEMLLKALMALDGVAQWIECQPAKQRVAGSIPSQGIFLGCRPGPHMRVFER